jgi:hypothetical protein
MVDEENSVGEYSSFGLAEDKVEMKRKVLGEFKVRIESS